jgi:hypothetical protein
MDRLRALCTVTVAAAGVLLAAGCRDHAQSASHIFGGMVRVVRVGPVRSPPLRACLRRYPELRVTHRTRVVLRDGVFGASMTITDPASPWLYGCDFAPTFRRLCGGAVGEWRRRHLNDPRLDILCADRSQRHLGAAWVVPLPRARSIVVRERRVTEVYPVVGGLPVRIWTRDGVRYARSSAVFFVTQRALDGHVLAREQLRAMVAG